jgi:CRP-like cAMP-binding protein
MVLSNSSRITYGAANITYQSGAPDRCDILIAGMARTYLTSSQGRQTTMRYVHPGELMGGLLVMGHEFDGSVQAVQTSTAIHLDLANFRRLVATDPQVAEAFAADLAARYAHMVRTLRVHAFGTVAQRVAFDLLDRACGEQLNTGELEVSVSQQELADGVGSVRETVARSIGQLRDRGLITTERHRIRVLKPRRLENFALVA